MSLDKSLSSAQLSSEPFLSTQPGITSVPIDDHSISDEIIYIVTAFFFSAFVSTLGGLLGVSFLLPAIQAIVLTIFMLPLLRRSNIKRALMLLFGWIVVQFAVILFLSMVASARMETTIADGFNRQTGMLAWFYASDVAPSGLVSSISTRLLETVGIFIGSVATAGLVGFWLLLRGVNLAAFYAGTLLSALSDTASGMGAFPLWTLLRLTGYSLLATISAGTLVNRQSSFLAYLRRFQPYLLVAIICIVLGLIFENTLTDVWRTWFS